MTATKQEAGVQLIPLAQLKASPTQPRKRFDQGELEGLAESIRSVGVLEPIVVRRDSKRVKLTKDMSVGEFTGLYEIVAGERRVRAAKLAGLEVIPATVRELNDSQVSEIQQIENVQRQDLDAYEEACGYQALVEQHQYTAEDIAKKIGKSKAHVYGMLKLATDLPPKALEALQEGAISKSVAQLIARVPNKKLRDEATKEILQTRWRSEPMSFRQAEHFVQQRYMIELKQAPFNLTDGELVPEAGSCQQCPKRAGNNPELFPGTRADVCTDPGCYATKVKAHQQRLLDIHKDSGKKVLSKSESGKLFKRYDPTSVDYQAPYFDLAAQCDADPKYRSYKQLLLPELEAEVVIAVDEKGGIHQLIAKQRAREVLRQKKIGRKSEPSDNGKAWKRMQAENRKKQLADAAVAKRMAEAAVVAAEHKFASMVGWTPSQQDLLREMTALILDEVWHDHQKKIISRRGLDVKDVRRDLAKHVRTLSAAECLGFFAEIIAIRDLVSYRDDAKEFWELLGVNRAKLKREVKAELAKKKRSPQRPQRAQSKARK